MKFLLLLLSLFKYGKLGSILLSAGTIFLSIGIYAGRFGWLYAIGVVGLIFCHEMGHYIAAKQKNLQVGLPIFIPFVGAWIELKEKPLNVEVEAYVAFAGPFVGTLAAFVMYYYGRSTSNGLCLALAQIGFLINLFNLIPLHPLDGGRITAIISPRFWLLGIPVLIALFFYHPSPLLIFIAIFAFPQAIKSWKYDPHSPENQHYYNINAIARFEYATLYLILLTVLSALVYSLNAEGVA